MTEELEIYLSGGQVGITVCSVGLGVGEPLTSYGSVRREIGQVLPSRPLPRAAQRDPAHRRHRTDSRAGHHGAPLGGSLSTSVGLHASLQEMRVHPYNRYPLLDPDWENVYRALYLTIVFRHLPELERGDTTLADIAEPVVWVNPELPISELIHRLQQKQQELALVRPDGHARGLVTSTDAFEAIAGEI